jgi:NADH:ubiquinone oxidoreductase subunit E
MPPTGVTKPVRRQEMEDTEMDSAVHPRHGGIGHAGRIFAEIQRVMDDTHGQAGALIRVLQKAQGLIGYLPAPVIKTISRDLRVPLSEVYGIISFYHFFTMVPKGRHVIQVCMGTSCYVKGSQGLLDRLRDDWGLEPEDITADGRFSLETVRCLGCCGLSPVIAVDDDVHRKVKASHLRSILRDYS